MQWFSEYGTCSDTTSNYVLDISSIVLLQGEFPRAVADAPDLLALHVEENSLTGKLPSKPGMLPNLLDFDVQGNLLEGEIPQELANIRFFDSKVTGISHVQSRQWITGVECAGEQLGTVMPFLITVGGNDSQVVGKLAEMLPLGGQISLQFDLSHNSLSGVLPPFLYSDRIPDEIHGRIKLEVTMGRFLPYCIRLISKTKAVLWNSRREMILTYLALCQKELTTWKHSSV